MWLAVRDKAAQQRRKHLFYNKIDEFGTPYSQASYLIDKILGSTQSGGLGYQHSKSNIDPKG